MGAPRGDGECNNPAERGEWSLRGNQYHWPPTNRVGAPVTDPPNPALQLSVLSAVTLQLYHLVFDPELFLLQPVDLEVVGARSRHFFLDLQFQGPVLFGKLCEMSGKRHVALRWGVEGT